MTKLHQSYLSLIDARDEAIEAFINQLPHGSGIDGKWEIVTSEHSQYVYLCNFYHLMNDMGYYIGYQDFRVRIDKADYIKLIHFMAIIEGGYKASSPFIDSVTSDLIKLYVNAANSVLDKINDEFTLQFTNGDYLARYYDLRDYLTDTIALTFNHWLKELIK